MSRSVVRRHDHGALQRFPGGRKLLADDEQVAQFEDGLEEAGAKADRGLEGGPRRIEVTEVSFHNAELIVRQGAGPLGDSMRQSRMGPLVRANLHLDLGAGQHQTEGDGSGGRELVQQLEGLFVKADATVGPGQPQANLHTLGTLFECLLESLGRPQDRLEAAVVLSQQPAEQHPGVNVPGVGGHGLLEIRDRFPETLEPDQGQGVAHRRPEGCLDSRILAQDRPDPFTVVWRRNQAAAQSRVWQERRGDQGTQHNGLDS